MPRTKVKNLNKTTKTKPKKDESDKKKESSVFKKANKLPVKPGLYAWLDADGQPIYIGKAKNIRKRAKQHITKGKSTKDVQKFREEAEQPVYKFVQQPGYLDKLEKIAVRAYKPKYNDRDFL